MVEVEGTAAAAQVDVHVADGDQTHAPLTGGTRGAARVMGTEFPHQGPGQAAELLEDPAAPRLIKQAPLTARADGFMQDAAVFHEVDVGAAKAAHGASLALGDLAVAGRCPCQPDLLPWPSTGMPAP